MNKMNTHELEQRTVIFSIRLEKGRDMSKKLLKLKVKSTRVQKISLPTKKQNYYINIVSFLLKGFLEKDTALYLRCVCNLLNQREFYHLC